MKLRFLSSLLSFVLVFGLAVKAAPPGFSKTIRVLQLNIYGRDDADCRLRMKTIADKVLKADPPYDIVSFNENWNPSFDPTNISCDGSILPKLIAADPRYSDQGDVVRSIRHLPRGDAFQASGGNTLFSLHPIRDAYENQFVNSSEIPISGFAQARIEISPGVFVSYWDAHLEAKSDGCDDDCRLEQFTDLASVAVGWDPNPTIVGGDFNLGGPTSKAELLLHQRDPALHPYAGHVGYHDLLRELDNPIDVWLELNPYPIPYFGDGYTRDCIANSIVAREHCSYRERIDFMFLLRDRRSADAEYQAIPRSAWVVKWKTPGGQDVSDHFGLDAVFEIKHR